MKIGLIGDIHGRVFHTLAIINEWQIRHQARLDLLIQVGDLGAYPEPDEALRSKRFYMQDPSQLDFSLLIKAEADPALSANLRCISSRMPSPIYFIRGNHEDFAWLNKQRFGNEGTAAIDPFDLFRYVQDGTVLKFGDRRIGFLGGIETASPEERSIDERSYSNFMSAPPRELDLLITHDAPYGIGTNYHGQTQGSHKITALMEMLEPGYLIAGHYHHAIGPKTYGHTTYLGLNVIRNLRREDGCHRVEPGWFAVLDTEKDELLLVSDDWLADFCKDFDFNEYCANLKTIRRP